MLPDKLPKTLTNQQIKELYTHYRAHPKDAKTDYSTHVQRLAERWKRFAELSSEDLGTEGVRAQLFGEERTVQGPVNHRAIEPGEIAEDLIPELIKLRREELPSNPEARANVLQEAFTRALEKLTKSRSIDPNAWQEIARAFATLFYNDFQSVFYPNSGTLFASFGVEARIPEHFIKANVLVRARLREALGEIEHSYEEHAWRAYFFFWLWNRYVNRFKQQRMALGIGGGPARELPEEQDPAWLLSELPEPLSPDDEGDEDREKNRGPKDGRWVSLAKVREAFQTDPKARRLVLEEGLLEQIDAAWHCNEKKRFIILSGLSGTGKTQIIRHYARLYCKESGISESTAKEKHIELVPVSPDWRDPSGLLGYVNTLHGQARYHAEPALRLLLRAANHPDLPYFLILDEMNLARVEQYFAPLLSAMESGDPIPLHGHGTKLKIEGDDSETVPARLEWPTNLFIAGTVNMDETTYPFSDKVLDRAFTFEFWDVDLEEFFKRRDGGVRDDERDLLLALHEVLKKVRRHFGYRTVEEVLNFVNQAPETKRTAYLDQAIFSKILPRIRGEKTVELETALMRALELCSGKKETDAEKNKDLLPNSARKLRDMKQLLNDVGFTKFSA